MRHCLTLDLKNDVGLIAEYKAYHAAVWPEITANIRGAGIFEMEIYLLGNRLFMIMECGRAVFLCGEGRGGSSEPEGTGVGGADVA